MCGFSVLGLWLVLDFINVGGVCEGWFLGLCGEKGGGVDEDEEMDEVSLLFELVEVVFFFVGYVFVVVVVVLGVV